MSRVDIFLEGDVSLPFQKITASRIRKITNACIEALELKKVSLTLILCDNQKIQEVNKNFRKKDYPTDVISFAYRDEPFPVGGKELEPLGDVYLSLDKALEQSIEYKVSFDDELIRLIVHSLCHLVGFDHERSKKDEKIMHAKEDEVIGIIKKEIGISKK